MTDAFNKDRLYAENQDLRERIAELESHNLGLTKTLVELEKQVEFEMEQKAKAREQRDKITKSLPIRDLEQQAKGVVKGYVSACKWALGSQYDECVAKNRAIIYAKQLKEQGDE